jgi:VRR-NUC domain
MSEAALQAAVIDLAHVMGWRVAHFRPAFERGRYRTPVDADGAGFPDLLMVRDGRIIVAELKSATGRLSAAQTEWLDAFARCHRVVVATQVWTPKEWLDGTILRALRREWHCTRDHVTEPCGECSACRADAAQGR